MGRPKGSKNKPKIECRPPEDRPSVPTECRMVVFDAQIKVIRKSGDRLDGTYVVGKMPDGKDYIAKLGWSDPVPQTHELLKLLGLE